MSFPELVLASMVVAAGIFVLDMFSPEAAWLLTILILLIVAYRYQAFANELSKILSVSSPVPNQDPNFDPNPGPIGQIPLSLPGP
jgi:hypothetical protein